jgi:hypothetical protein
MLLDRLEDLETQQKEESFSREELVKIMAGDEYMTLFEQSANSTPQNSTLKNPYKIGFFRNLQ